jgi:Flp pilus assembly protein TadG
MKTMSSRIWRRARLSAIGLFRDRRGIAATEFAIIVPMMLIMFFGVIEFSSGVAVDRKVTLVARTEADLTGQAPADPTNQNTATVTDTYLLNAFNASGAILQPYLATPAHATISEIYVDTSNVAKIQWSKAATFASSGAATLVNSSRNAGDVVTTLVPSSLRVAQTYVILSEVSYLYTPTVGYVMGVAGVSLNDVAYTRPRLVQCVVYNNLPVVPAAPQSACPSP